MVSVSVGQRWCLVFYTSWKVYFVSIGWHDSRYRIMEWLKLEETSGGQVALPPLLKQGHLEMFGSTIYLLPSWLWVWPRTACSSMQGSWHFLPPFVFDGMELSLTWMRWSFKTNQISGALFPSKASSHVTLSSRSLKMLESVLTTTMTVSLIFPLLSAPRFLNSSQGRLWLSDAQQAPHCLCLWGPAELISSDSCMEKDVLISVIQELPGLLMPVVLSFQEITSQFIFSLN